MTEQEWLACANPQTRLEFLRGKASDRKIRLFACAACLGFSHELEDAWSRKVVEVALDAADDKARKRELDSFDTKAYHAAETSAYPVIARAAADLSLENPWHSAISVARYHVTKGSPLATALVADIFGNPFRPITVNPAWLTPTVVSLAQTSYEELTMPSRELDPVRLFVFSDAIEEAGCTDGDILGHLRRQGPHVRGCWPLDLVLGKG